MFNDYQGSLNCWLDYVTHYKKQKIEQRLYERYTANFIGKIAGAEKSYDDVLQKLDNVFNKKKERGADDIKQDLMIKFNKRS